MIASPTFTFVRRWLPTLALLAGASALLLVTDRAGTRRSRPAVAVLKQVSTAVLDDAVTGMLEGLAEKGWRDGETVTIRQFNAEGDMAQANAIAREITGGGYDMVLTSSTPSLQAVATANDRGRVKHVFAAVADPFSAGVGLDRADPLVHPPHLVGYGSLAPVHATFGILRRINPRVSRVGVAHNPAESNSRRFMELARASCQDRGIELLEAAVENSSGVVEAVQATIARGAEVIFVPGDTTVAGVCDSVVAVAAKAGIPVFTLVPGRPDRGTLFDVGFDFREVGLLAGRLAGDILAGRDPATVPIGETAREIPPRLTVNLTAPGVDRATWRVPDDLLAQAKVVIDAGGRRDQPEAVLAGPFPEADDLAAIDDPAFGELLTTVPSLAANLAGEEAVGLTTFADAAAGRFGPAGDEAAPDAPAAARAVPVRGAKLLSRLPAAFGPRRLPREDGPAAPARRGRPGG